MKQATFPIERKTDQKGHTHTQTQTKPIKVAENIYYLHMLPSGPHNK